MDPMGIGLFNLADQRMSWLDKRQQVLAQNVANADTPKWQSRDLKPFAAALEQASSSSPVQTNPLHLAGTQGGLLQEDPLIRPPERSPDGNAVALDTELANVANTETAQQLVINLYRKYVGMFRLALGHSP